MSHVLKRGASLALTLVLMFLTAWVNLVPAHAEPVALTGRLDVVFVDGVDGSHRTETYVRADDGRRYKLNGHRARPDDSGRRATVRGQLRKGSVGALSGTVDAATVATTGPVSDLTTLGNRSVLVVLATKDASDSVTPASAEQLLDGSAHAHINAGSYGQVGVDATVTPWLVVAADGGCDDFYGIISGAEAAASNAGIEPSGYDHVMVYSASARGCGWAGRGVVGGRHTVLAGGYFDKRVSVHELGHNFGLWHSDALTCRDGAGTGVPLSATCTRTEYGDTFDAMGDGFAGVGHFNAAQKDRLGWLAGRSATYASDASFVLAPYDTGAALSSAAVDVAGRRYWLELRRPRGEDAWLGNFPTAVDGVLVHTAGSPGTDLLDLRAGTAGHQDAALAAGSSWLTPEGLRITVREQTTAGVRIDLDFDAASATVPGVPVSVVAVRGGAAGTATVSWQPPASDGGSLVTGYRVARDGTDAGGAGPWSTTVAAGARSHTFASLVPGAVYELSVQVINAVGTGTAGTARVTMDGGGAGGGARFVSDLPFVSASNAWGPVERDRSNGEAGAADGRTLTLQGQTFVKGLGMHAGSDVRFVVPAGCTTLTAVVGLDDEVGSGGSAVFQVFDGVSKTFDSGARTGASANVAVTATLTPGATARLVTTDNGNGNGQDHTDWADAKLTCKQHGDGARCAGVGGGGSWGCGGDGDGVVAAAGLGWWVLGDWVSGGARWHGWPGGAGPWSTTVAAGAR